MNDSKASPGVIERTLWHEVDGERIAVAQAELVGRVEPLVILGEAGMGKSHLLEWIASLPGYSFCTARQLINCHDPRTLKNDTGTLVIDALDEVSAHKDGDAVGLVLLQLGKLSYPRFVMSCRVADWRSTTGTEAIREQYSARPLELHLEPFTDDDATAFLSASLGAEKAASVIRHFNSRGLEGLLGNPQTLQLIARVASTNALPETRGELFDKAIELLRVEHRHSKAEKQPSRAAGLDAAGAAFAALILTGNEAVTRAAIPLASEGEIPITEITPLPGGAAIEAMLDTRLFKAYGPNRFSYWHRRIGEFLGAQWLAKQADTPRKRRRLLSLFQGHGLVPSSLRGLHAWLARDPALARAVIESDPLGVAEYGDADVLTPTQARQLFDALKRLGEKNPFFYNWGSPSVRGIFQPAILDDIGKAITSPETPFGMRLFLIKATKGTPTITSFDADLRNLVLDPKTVFAIRSAAAQALTALQNGDDGWRHVIRTLQALSDDDSVRLAIEILDAVGFHVADDAMIVDLVIANVVSEERVVGVLYPLETGLPDHRIDGVLDVLAKAAFALGKPHRRPGDMALTDFAYTLVTRRVSRGDISAEKLWSWLEPFDASSGYRGDRRRQLEELVRSNNSLRHTIQYLVILDLPGDQTIWQRTHRLSRRSPGFAPTTEDVVQLLQSLDPDNQTDERWKEVVQIIRHDKENGVEVRAAAHRFAANHPDLLEWIEELANPPTPEWEIEQGKRKRLEQTKRDREHAKHRKNYETHLDQVQSGNYGWGIQPAQAYLNLFYDIGDGLPAHERVAQWLGKDVAEAAHRGFEAFISLDPPDPSARDIAEALSEGKHYDAGYIIVACLAERIRKGLGLADLPTERVTAGLFVLRRTKVDHHAGIDGLEEAVEAEIVLRGCLEEAMRLYHEPQLQARRDHVDGLYSLMRDDKYSHLAVDLALEWLNRFEDLPADVEEELIARVIRSGRFDELREAVARREGATEAGRRRTWDAAGLLVDFDRTVERLAQAPVDPELLWHLRDLADSRSRNSSGALYGPKHIEWIVTTFRSLWPIARRPVGGWSGSRNPWDASEYLVQTLRRLGGDPSEEALRILERLKQAPFDSYTETIRSIASEQATLRVEAKYTPPPLSAIEAIARDLAPTTADDLKAVMMEELSIVQAKVRSDDAESWRGFFSDNGAPYPEERCRDHLLGLLRQGSTGIQLDPESHVAGDKEVDITCSTGNLRIPIEIKGQWHADLWHGADTQLDRLYAADWRAERRGIYLALWFGDRPEPNKRLTSPGKGKARPNTSEELLWALVDSSRAAKEGRTTIFVMDLVRD
ncbi:NACHT domain-containing protein [Luteimonas salinilitoris]|uniref:NACHT domain-containing NTPase n=1 Tax=Luteimonas salinilitoris TaxID=3237697 RepID=A0ABV4HNG9_9GAMM